MSLKLAILISGGGSNLQAIIDSIEAGMLDSKIVMVIGDCPDAYGLQRAQDANVPHQVIDYDAYESKTDFENALLQATQSTEPDLVVLAGFMRILGDSFIRSFAEKIVNIHPSLLPKYKGLHTHQRALDAGDRYHGATVHFVTQTLDDGPIIVQATISIKAHDTAESLQARVLEQEHIIYPKAISHIANGSVDFHNSATP